MSIKLVSIDTARVIMRRINFKAKEGDKHGDHTSIEFIFQGLDGKDALSVYVCPPPSSATVEIIHEEKEYQNG